MTEAEFAKLPIKTQEFYSGKSVGNIITTTQYFKAVPASINTINSASADGVTSADKVLIEVSQAEFEMAEAAFMNNGINLNSAKVSDSRSGEWYSITVSLIEVEHGIGITIGPYGQYVFSMDVTVFGAEMDPPPGLRTDHSGYIAGSINSACTPVSGGEMCTITLYPNLGGPTQDEYYNDAPYKSSAGYGFDYSIGFMASKAEMFMTFAFQPLFNTAYVDAFSHVGYWDINDSNLSFSLSIGFGSVSVNPTNSLIQAPDIHLQMQT